MSLTDLHPPITQPLGNVTTLRLDLRRFDDSDLDEIAALSANPDVWGDHLGQLFDRAETQTFLDRQITHWAQRHFGYWAARDRMTGRMIGYVGLSVPTFLPAILPTVDLGWRFASSAWGNGYASEGARAALDQAFSTMELQHVCSIVQADNLRSRHVTERLGMRPIDRYVVPANKQRDQVTVIHYEINRSDWITERYR